ncbi:MAG: rod shape-determining protein MreD [Elusimicrobia bacterium]|nr:rod shape-determining protein MreD [Elusimicrobiota bacterium]
MRLKHPVLFGVATFAMGWILQIGFLSFLRPGQASPQWLLLAVMVLGSLGYTNLAQTLGLFWGLSLDVFGASLFGTQGFLLAVAGYGSGRFSRQLNAEKIVTQEALALFGTLFFWLGFAAVEHFFRPASPHPSSSLGAAVLTFLFNAGVVPVLSWMLFKWLRFWAFLERNHIFVD